MELHLLAGPPGSGKSTKSYELRKALPDAVFISCDELIERVARYYSLDYGDIFHKVIGRSSKRMKKRLKFAKENKLPVIWDMCNLSQAERIVRTTNFPEYKKILYFTNLPWEELLRRNDLRPRGPLNVDKVLRPKFKDYEVPSAEEIKKHWDEVYEIGS